MTLQKLKCFLGKHRFLGNPRWLFTEVNHIRHTTQNCQFCDKECRGELAYTDDLLVPEDEDEK